VSRNASLRPLTLSTTIVLALLAAPAASARQVSQVPTAGVPSQVPQATEAPAPRARRPNMQAIADALGVQCTYCHVAGPDASTRLDYRSDANPKKRIARMMIAMTADINASVPAAILKPAGETMTVHCVTCHRGRADPRPLADIMLQLVADGSADVAVERYRELRDKYFSLGTYDFSERALLMVAQRIVEGAPEAALALLRMNVEFYPRSADSYVLMGVAHTRAFRDADAIGAFEQALEIDPMHALAQGRLYQLRQYRPKPDSSGR
jgi:tetratricopeptide (TPR) repeat protein